MQYRPLFCLPILLNFLLQAVASGLANSGPSSLLAGTTSDSPPSQPTTPLNSADFPLSSACISIPFVGQLPTTPIPGKAITSGYTKADLESLWNLVEVNGPVQRAQVTNVLDPLPNFSVGPNPPPFRQGFISYNTSGLKFPRGFKYGVASAAQQVEGAAKDGGRGPSPWDYGCHVIPAFCNGYTADITVNTYYQYKQDIQRLKGMGVNTLSFSISWSRVLPFGAADSPINEEGVQFYNNLIDELLANDIEPVVTLFHWDPPLNLILKYGAFLSDEIIDDFNSYAKQMFKRFGDRVKMWVTFNEPNVNCGQHTSFPYIGNSPKGVNASTAFFQCARHMLLAHGTAAQTYRSLISSGNVVKGQIAMKYDSTPSIPADPNNSADVVAAERYKDFHIGLWARPIFVDGTFPDSVLTTIPRTTLPEFNSKERALLIHSSDFFAIDGYTTSVSRGAPGGIDACSQNPNNPNWPICADLSTNTAQWTTSDGWGVGTSADPLSPWLQYTPQFVRRTLRILHNDFPAPGGIYMTEFGFSEPFEELRPDMYSITWDMARSTYLTDTLNELLLAVHEDHIPLKGAFVWSYVDNFEWNTGLQTKFGLQYVNHSTPGLERFYKLSFFQVRDFFRQHLQT